MPELFQKCQGCFRSARVVVQLLKYYNLVKKERCPNDNHGPTFMSNMQQRSIVKIQQVSEKHRQNTTSVRKASSKIQQLSDIAIPSTAHLAPNHGRLTWCWRCWGGWGVVPPSSGPGSTWVRNNCNRRSRPHSHRRCTNPNGRGCCRRANKIRLRWNKPR